MTQPDQIRKSVVLSVPIFVVNNKDTLIKAMALKALLLRVATFEDTSIRALATFPVQVTTLYIQERVSPDCLTGLVAEEFITL